MKDSELDPKRTYSELNGAIVYGNRRIAAACKQATISCVFIDPTSTITKEDIVADGLHPTTTGSQKLADLIWGKILSWL